MLLNVPECDIVNYQEYIIVWELMAQIGGKFKLVLKNSVLLFNFVWIKKIVICVPPSHKWQRWHFWITILGMATFCGYFRFMHFSGIIEPIWNLWDHLLNSSCLSYVWLHLNDTSLNSIPSIVEKYSHVNFSNSYSSI